MAGIKDLAKAAGLKTSEVDDVFAQALKIIASGEVLKIRNFGVFQRRLYAGKTIKSPIIEGGELIKFPDTFALRFRQSASAKKRLNAGKPKVKPKEAPALSKLAHAALRKKHAKK